MAKFQKKRQDLEPRTVVVPPAFVVVQHSQEPQTGQIATQITVEDVCVCQGYEGQGWQCPKHTAKNECPKCKCVEADREWPGALAPMKQLQCSICGIFYLRNQVTGEYIHF